MFFSNIWWRKHYIIFRPTADLQSDVPGLVIRLWCVSVYGQRDEHRPHHFNCFNILLTQGCTANIKYVPHIKKNYKTTNFKKDFKLVLTVIP